MTTEREQFANRLARWETAEANALEAAHEAVAAVEALVSPERADELRRQAQQLRLLANEMRQSLMLTVSSATHPSRKPGGAD